MGEGENAKGAQKTRKGARKKERKICIPLAGREREVRAQRRRACVKPYISLGKRGSHRRSDEGRKEGEWREIAANTYAASMLDRKYMELTE